ncbi:hypothetical protein [Bdellovibrio svalbardensis]|uniref:Lipoprotein n=1 Tax=Bdellovibrio svalbardensis TaxID=2972972 RepID=A0ABT6DGV5_9BACT|nr:hypothetical protein [Bdellovibrio svalbardensis]MDG0815739.1 hypothetical protein [Bdellovibrio svalbardensis]
MEKKSFKNLLLLSAATTLCAACAKVSFSPVDVTTEAAITPSKTVTLSEVVAYGNKQVDFLVVFDDSNSMLPDLQKLAASLGSFVTSLESSDIDWQMCMTTTRSLMVGGSPTWGTSYNWVGYTPKAGTPNSLLKRGTANLDGIFVNTVNSLQIGGAGSGDERGIKTAYEHFKSGALSNVSGNGCYRAGAAVSVIIVSNEDERSVGGDQSKVKATDAAGSYQPLEAEDLPINLVSQAQSSFGADVRFTFNSIIVKPGDSTCEAKQDASGTSPSHPGAIYAQASNMTDGGVGSICDANFASSLNTFKDKIVNSMSHLTLQCEPDPATVKVVINSQEFTQFTIDKNLMKFKTPLIEGTKIDLKFDCK